MATATVKTQNEILKEKYPAMATALGAGGVLLNAAKKQETIPSGVSKEAWEATQQKFEASETQNSLDATAQSDLSHLRDVASKDKIINNVTWNEINSSFSTPSAVKEADRYLAQQLQKIQSGRTSYSDKVEAMMDKIANREEFTYDVDNDTLFQQALASAMKSGKQAMQDTIGQASALTGGYGSTYATTAGNQVYNDFIEDAYDNLPQYYQMAMDKYQMEGDELYRQLGMYNDADTKEYERMLTAYDATYAHRNQVYNEAYTQYRDEKSDAFAKANLMISEHGQLVTDAYNLYTASSSYADSQYQREYNTWLDSVNNAFKTVEIQNADYWEKTNFDEKVRQYEQDFAENVRQFDMTYEQNDRFHADEMALGYADIAAANARNAASIASAEKMQQFGFAHDKEMNTIGFEQDKELLGIKQGYDLETLGIQNNFTAGENEKNRNWESGENAKYNLTVDQQLGLKSGSGGSGGSGGGSGGKPVTLTDAETKYITKIFQDSSLTTEQQYAKVADYLATRGKDVSKLGEGTIEFYRSEANDAVQKNINNPKATGTAVGLNTKEGKNFTVSVGNKTYKVQSGGRASDNAQALLANMNVAEGEVFSYTYNGVTRLYVKSGGVFYKVEGRTLNGDDLDKLKAALKK